MRKLLALLALTGIALAQESFLACGKTPCISMITTSGPSYLLVIGADGSIKCNDHYLLTPNGELIGSPEELRFCAEQALNAANSWWKRGGE